MSQLGRSDDNIAQSVRNLQNAAYIQLETLFTHLQVLTEELRGFSPADRQYMELLRLLKNTAAMHTETEVKDTINTYDRTIVRWRPCCGM